MILPKAIYVCSNPSPSHVKTLDGLEGIISVFNDGTPLSVQSARVVAQGYNCPNRTFPGLCHEDVYEDHFDSHEQFLEFCRRVKGLSVANAIKKEPAAVAARSAIKTSLLAIAKELPRVGSAVVFCSDYYLELAAPLSQNICLGESGAGLKYSVMWDKICRVDLI